MRTLVDIPEDRLKALDVLARKRRVSRAEVIRNAVDEHLRRQPGDLDVGEVFGLWKDRKLDGLEYQRKLRSEW